MSPLTTADGRPFPVEPDNLRALRCAAAYKEFRIEADLRKRPGEEQLSVYPIYDRLCPSVKDPPADGRIAWPSDPLGFTRKIRRLGMVQPFRIVFLRSTDRSHLPPKRPFYIPIPYDLEVIRFLHPDGDSSSPDWDAISRQIGANDGSILGRQLILARWLHRMNSYHASNVPWSSCGLLDSLLDVRRTQRISELVDEASTGHEAPSVAAVNEETVVLKGLANDIREYGGVSPELRDEVKQRVDAVSESGIPSWRIKLWLDHADRSQSDVFRGLKPWLRRADELCTKIASGQELDKDLVDTLDRVADRLASTFETSQQQHEVPAATDVAGNDTAMSIDDPEARQPVPDEPVPDDCLLATLKELAMAMGEDEDEAKLLVKDWNGGGKKYKKTAGLKFQGKLGGSHLYKISEMVAHFAQHGCFFEGEEEKIKQNLVVLVKERQQSSSEHPPD